MTYSWPFSPTNDILWPRKSRRISTLQAGLASAVCSQNLHTVTDDVNVYRIWTESLIGQLAQYVERSNTFLHYSLNCYEVVWLYKGKADYKAFCRVFMEYPKNYLSWELYLYRIKSVITCLGWKLKPRPEEQTPCHSSFSCEIICGFNLGSFPVWESFSVENFLLCCTDRLYLDAAEEAAQDQENWGEIVNSWFSRWPFLERPGYLTGRESDFKIKASRKVGYVLTSNKVHFVSLSNNVTVQLILEPFETPIWNGKQKSLTGPVITGSFEKRALRPDNSKVHEGQPYPWYKNIFRYLCFV